MPTRAGAERVDHGSGGGQAVTGRLVQTPRGSLQWEWRLPPLPPWLQPSLVGLVDSWTHCLGQAITCHWMIISLNTSWLWCSSYSSYMSSGPGPGSLTLCGQAVAAWPAPAWGPRARVPLWAVAVVRGPVIAAGSHSESGCAMNLSSTALVVREKSRNRDSAIMMTSPGPLVAWSPWLRCSSPGAGGRA